MMGRKITEKEIEGLKKWNKERPNQYISVEQYQDVLDWCPLSENNPLPQDVIDEIFANFDENKEE